MPEQRGDALGIPLVGPPAVAEYERVGQAVAIDLQREAARGPLSQQPATHLRGG